MKRKFRKRIFVAAGYNTTYFGPGRKEFDPSKPMRGFESYLKEAAEGTSSQIPNPQFDEGILGSFMPGRFLKQANLPGLLPFMIPQLHGKPCTGVEGACGTGGRSIATAMRSILSDMADVVFVAAFEVQNTMKSVYGADVLAGAAYYHGERKGGHAHFFPGIFSDRAGVYFERYDKELARQSMAKWYEQAIINARKNPKAQEYHNSVQDLYQLGMTPPSPKTFLPHLNPYDCSKITDGASSLVILSEEGLKKCGISEDMAMEIVAIGEAEGDITQRSKDPAKLDITEIAVQKASDQAGISKEELGLLEIHDCFSITALLSLEAIGFSKRGEAPSFILEGNTLSGGSIPTNLSGGLIGFGHPTGASGVRQLVDLLHQFTQKAVNQIVIRRPYGMLVSMGGDDKTLTAIILEMAVEGDK